MKKYAVVMIAVLFAALMAQAIEVRQLGVEEMARYGASHVVTIKYSDFTETTTNTTETFTVDMEAKMGVEFVAMQLVEEFEADNDTTLTLTAGDEDDPDFMFAATHIGEEGTAVWLVLPSLVTTAQAVTPNTGGAAVNVLASAAPPSQEYTADKELQFLFTPDDTADALADFTAGEVRIYLEIYDFR